MVAYNIFSGGSRITQYFGENPESYSNYGLLGHDGLDLVPVDNDFTVHSYTNGIAIHVYVSSTYGNTVIVLDVENNLAVRYAHFKELYIQQNQIIKFGDALGVAGNTGNSSGIHLHTHVVPIDKFGQKLYSDNGFKGRCDPLPLIFRYL